MRSMVMSTLLLFAGGAFAADGDTTPENATPETTAEDSAEAVPAPPELRYQTGSVVLPNKVATLNLGETYRYLDPGETEKLLVAWGNPPGFETQGAIVPTSTDPFGEEGWAVVLTYIDDGHVSDEDAAEIDYAKMLKDMKEGEGDENKERAKQGYATVELVGWAAEPHYDSVSRKLYWAKELRFGDSKVNTLNYDVRVLGREGVLSMNAVAGMPQLDGIERDMRDLLRLASFNEGFRYEEYNKSTDRLAAYGLGALVAGGLAAKAGLFAKLAAILIAAKKFIFIAIAALVAWLGRLFKGKKSETA